jgi:ABC-type antimicrobial peptide transport system permease subunit
MNVLLQDVLYGFRVLRKKPAFTGIAAFSLALGIGVNTAIFTLINTILRHAVAEIDPNRPLVDPKTVEQYMAEQVQYPRYYSMLLGLFSAVALALAAVGIYGVMAYAVAQRTREIGIRMALGAKGWDVLKLVVRQALLLIVGGLLLGLAGAMALTRFLSSQLWEVTASDPIATSVPAHALSPFASTPVPTPVYYSIHLLNSMAIKSQFHPDMLLVHPVLDIGSGERIARKRGGWIGARNCAGSGEGRFV